MHNALVILDIDQTLIDSRNGPYGTFIIDERPHIKEFLQYLHKNFRYIAIWTNGSDMWLKHVVANVLNKYLPQNRYLFLYSYRFSTLIDNGFEKYYFKDLYTIWNNKDVKSLGISHKNTILIDDNKHNCMGNRINSIPIRPYTMYNKKDNGFTRIVNVLKELKKSRDYSATLRKVYSRLNYDDFFIG